MIRLSRAQLANALVLWDRGNSTYQIMLALNQRHNRMAAGNVRANDLVVEAQVANSLADVRERRYRERRMAS